MAQSNQENSLYTSFSGLPNPSQSKGSYIHHAQAVPQSVTPEKSKSFNSGGTSNASNNLMNSHIMELLRNSKRRIVQQMLVKLKHAEASDDSEYQALRARHMDLHDQVVGLTTHIKSFATNLLSLGHIGSLIGEQNIHISMLQKQATTSFQAYKQTESVSRHLNTGHGDDDDPNNILQLTDGVNFRNTMIQVENTARELVNIMFATVIAELEKKVDVLNILKKKMDNRERLKLDFDSAVRKLRTAQDKRSNEDVARRDIKLQAARVALMDATEFIVKEFLHYESIRSTLITHEIQRFREQQAKFFSYCASSYQLHENVDHQ